MGRHIREGGHPAKQQRRAARSKLRKVATGVADLREQLDRRTRELDDALQQQVATSEVLRIIRQSPADAQPVFDAIVQSASRLCGAIFGVVYLYDGDRLRIAATNNFTPTATIHLNELQQLKRPERSHLGGRAILDRKIVHVPDVLEDPEYSHEFALAGGWRAVLAVPLLREGIPIGALTAAKAEAAPFSDRQIQLLRTFADQAVIAIENVRLFEAEQQRTRELSEALEQQTATSEVLKVISSSPGELEPVFKAMLENAVRICSANFGNLWLREGNNFRIGATHGAPPAYVKARRHQPVVYGSPINSLSRIIETKKLQHIIDFRTEQAYIERDPGAVVIVEAAGARTVLLVPMLKENEPIGVVAVYRQEVLPFTDKQIELVQNFAAQAVIAIENTRLLNELRESLQQQTTTADVLKVISRSTFDLQIVLDTLTNSAAGLCDADMAAIIRQKGAANYWATSYGFPPEHGEHLKKLPIQPGRGSVAGRVLGGGQNRSRS